MRPAWHCGTCPINPPTSASFYSPAGLGCSYTGTECFYTPVGTDERWACQHWACQ